MTEIDPFSPSLPLTERLRNLADRNDDQEYPESIWNASPELREAADALDAMAVRISELETPREEVQYVRDPEDLDSIYAVSSPNTPERRVQKLTQAEFHARQKREGDWPWSGVVTIPAAV